MKTVPSADTWLKQHGFKRTTPMNFDKYDPRTGHLILAEPRVRFEPKLKFKLIPHPNPDYIAWECVAGHGYWRGSAITPGCTITFSRWYFWEVGVR